MSISLLNTIIVNKPTAYMCNFQIVQANNRQVIYNNLRKNLKTTFHKDGTYKL